MSDVAHAWDRIIRWYEAHAPTKIVGLAGSAAIEEVRELELVLGVSLPTDVIESYRLHNGSGGRAFFPYGDDLLSLQEIAKTWRFMCDISERTFKDVTTSPKGPIKKVWWNKKWVPLLSNSGDHHFIDLDPARRGHIGQFVQFWNEGGPERVMAKSFGQYLANYATALEQGKYHYDEDDDDVILLNDDD